MRFGFHATSWQPHGNVMATSLKHHSGHPKMHRRSTDFRDLGKDVSIAPGTTSDHWPKTPLSLPKRPYEATDPRVALNSQFSPGRVAYETREEPIASPTPPKKPSHTDSAIACHFPTPKSRIHRSTRTPKHHGGRPGEQAERELNRSPILAGHGRAWPGMAIVTLTHDC